MGPKRDQATFWSEQDMRVRSKQKRPGQARTKTFGEDEEGGIELILQAGSRDSPFWKVWSAALIIRSRRSVGAHRTRRTGPEQRQDRQTDG